MKKFKNKFDYYALRGDSSGFEFKQFIKKISSSVIGKIVVCVLAVIAIVIGFVIGLSRIEKD